MVSGIAPGEKVIAKTLQTYGAYVVDQAGGRTGFAFELVDERNVELTGCGVGRRGTRVGLLRHEQHPVVTTQGYRQFGGRRSLTAAGFAAKVASGLTADLHG